MNRFESRVFIAVMLGGLVSCAPWAMPPVALSSPPGDVAVDMPLSAFAGQGAGAATPQRPPQAGQPAAQPPAARPDDEADGSAAVRRGPARWVPAPWSELPGWLDDRTLEAWPALIASCERPAPGWSEVCARALLEGPLDEGASRRWLQTWLRPWRIEPANGQGDGLATGYFEPVLLAARQPSSRFAVAVHRPPSDLDKRQPHYTRQEFDQRPEARAALSGREIAWLANPLDLLLLQIQGSGRLQIVDAAQGYASVRLSFAGHNGHPYRSVGRWLIERGELRPEAASWPAIRAWAEANPHRVSELLWANPRVVFFREDTSLRPDQGPRGAQGVPLTPRRSVAVDPSSVPYGTALWIDTTEPLSSAPLRRLVMAQDTGSAIMGAVRIDFFWGSGDAALEQAGRMRQPLRKWALWPRDTVPPPSP